MLHHDKSARYHFLLPVLLILCAYSLPGFQEHARANTLQYIDGLPTVCYRGERIPAMTESDGTIIIEGDILVGPKDQWCGHNGSSPLPSYPTESVFGTATFAVRISGSGFRWPDGIVPFEIDAGFTPGQEDEIRDAMEDIEARVPGIDFRLATLADADRILFTPHVSDCSSRVGRQGGSQPIRLAPGCFGSFTVHHEILHALGVWHQHTARDRDDWVDIQWANIRGCTNAAIDISDCGPANCRIGADPVQITANLAGCGCTWDTDTDESCYRWFGQFRTDNNRSDIGVYDYDSVMHYGPGGTPAKGFGPTIVPTAIPGAVIGQRTHLSEGDILDLNAMYPVLRVPRTVVYTPGRWHEVCRLEGRHDDAATEFHIPTDVSNHPFSGEFAIVSRSAVVDSHVGSFSSRIDCEATSSFWAGNYDYPNADSSCALFPTSWLGSDWSCQLQGAERYETSGEVTFLPVALIPALL